MSWHSNVLSKFSGRQPGARDAWGDGLVDQSLASLWYRAEWLDVADDELVYLLPSLAAWRSLKDDANGPVDYLTRTLKARAQSAARLSTCDHPGADARPFLRRLAADGFLTSLVPDKGVGRARRIDYSRIPDQIFRELTALALLDRMLHDAIIKAPSGPRRRPLVDWPLSLADVVAASIVGRLNAAYVYPQYVLAHELLALAAILGNLVEGRAVYLPAPLAEVCVDVLTRGTDVDGCVAVLRTYANLAGGTAYLLARARRGAALGRPRLIIPRPPVAAADAGRATWNTRLARRLAAPSACLTSRAS